MVLSRKWLTEFVDLPLSEVGDREFDEAMTVSGSKVETTEDLSRSMKNVKVGRILSIERHPNSDHMLVLQLDVGEAEPVQICTGAWNVHVGDLVPAALHNARLPGGVTITKGKLRGVVSNGMLCSLKELNMTEHDFPYGVIEAAAILGDYKAIDPEKPSIRADIQPGERIYGKVVAARVERVENAGVNLWKLTLSPAAELVTRCQNLHEGDLVA
jgi:phenylalanyl-tRNA synthetase beta chain